MSRRFVILAILVGSFVTACPKRQPTVIVVPGDREIKAIPGEPGWFKISAGHLKELHDQQLDLVDALERCEGSANK